MKKFLMMLAVIVVLAGCNNSEQAANSSGSASAVKMQMASSETANGDPSTEITAGVGYLRSGQIKEAISRFDQAIKENPRDVRGYLVLGQTYMHLKDYNRAIDTFTAATQVAPANGEAHYLLATNYGMAGNFSMAKLEAEKCLILFRQQNDPDNFKRALALLQGLPQDQGKQVK